MSLRDIDFLDDASRPKGPKLEGLTDAQKEPGQHLGMIHEHFRDQMRQLRDLIERAAAGTAAPGELEAGVKKMPIFENYRRFGALCGQHCYIIHAHHSIEDQAIFPVLSAKSEALGKVVARLQAEHLIVHELLVRLVTALDQLNHSPDPMKFADVRILYEKLEKLLLSHFGYEEEEIGDALGYYGIGI